MTKAKATVTDVAEWMRDVVMSEDEYLEQSDVVNEIEERFGRRNFLYTNRNGNPAIRREVLAEFRRLTEGQVVWSPAEKAWRKQKTQKGKRLAY